MSRRALVNGQLPPSLSEEPKGGAVAAPRQPSVAISIIRVPFRKCSLTGYVSDPGAPARCYVQSMTKNQAGNLRRILAGLVAGDAKLMDGKFVQTGQDAVKWLLENIECET